MTIKTDARVEIVYDPKTKRIRARHEKAWVRFPKKLRQHGNTYVVQELRTGRAGSWLACGRITNAGMGK